MSTLSGEKKEGRLERSSSLANLLSMKSFVKKFVEESRNALETALSLVGEELKKVKEMGLPEESVILPLASTYGVYRQLSLLSPEIVLALEKAPIYFVYDITVPTSAFMNRKGVYLNLPYLWTFNIGRIMGLERELSGREKLEKTPEEVLEKIINELISRGAMSFRNLLKYVELNPEEAVSMGMKLIETYLGPEVRRQIEELQDKLLQGSWSEIRQSLTIPYTWGYGLVSPVIIDLLHELLHYTLAHDIRLERLMEKLRSFYPELMSKEEVERVVSDILNVLADAYINALLPLLGISLIASTRTQHTIYETFLPRLAKEYAEGGLVTPIRALGLRYWAEKARQFLSKLPSGATLEPTSKEGQEALKLLRELLEMLYKEVPSWVRTSTVKIGNELVDVGNLENTILENLYEVARRAGHEVNMKDRVRKLLDKVEKWLEVAIPKEEAYESLAMKIVTALLELLKRFKDLEDILEGTVPCGRRRGDINVKPRGKVIVRVGEEKEKSEEERQNVSEEIRERLPIVLQIKEVLNKTAGSSPLGFAREVELLKGMVDWRRLLLNIIAQYSRGLHMEESSWTAPSRVRGIPGTIRLEPRLLVLVDTSGSISDRELGRFLGEIKKIATETGIPIDVIFWDEEAYGPYSISNAVEVARSLVKQVAGGGGTMIRPALELALSHLKKIGMTRIPVIVFTDSEIFDILSNETLEKLRQLSRLAVPKLWFTTYILPPEQVRKLGWKTYFITVK